ncbi:MAG: sigma-70 family RNA polymerase sigma factor [Deltaproteobacteria bacterium]|nr:sigma-70 family RNA polymerase sigma factor [Deltaproteobacteria bacterium]
MTDELLDRARRGDRDALDALLAQAAPRIRRFARRMCRSEADADDVVQDTLLAATTSLGQFEGRSSVSSWLFVLARSACAHKRRGLANRPALALEALEDHADTAPSPETTTESRELHAMLDRALGALPEAYREVLVLRDLEGLTALEAADVLGLGVDALKSRLHRARAALHDGVEALTTPRTAAIAPQKDCPDVLLMLSRKLEGELTGIDCAAMEAHVSRCPACSARCSTLRAALAACTSTRGARG